MNDQRLDEVWYEHVGPGEDLSQGQVVRNFSIEVPAYDIDDSKSSLNQTFAGDFITLTQSCDYGDDSWFILLAGIESLTSAKISKPNFKELAKGKSPVSYVLPPSKEHGLSEYYVCHLFELYTVPLRVLRKFLSDKTSIRLKLPYREHFGHAVGRMLSRVALDQDLSRRSDFPK